MKWTNRIITGLVIVLLIILVLLLISTLYYNSDNKMGIGTLADWIIAGANIAMAGAAIFAAIKANSWFKDKIKNTAVDQALILLSKFDELKLRLDLFHLDLMMKTSYHTNKYIPNSTEQSTTKTVTMKDLEFDIDLINALESNLKKIHEDTAKFIRSIHNTERLGFEMKTDLTEKITNSLTQYSRNSWIHINYYKSPPAFILLTTFNPSLGDNDKTEVLCTLHTELAEAEKLLNRKIQKIFIFD